MTHPSSIALVGGGEHALVVADALERLGIVVVGCWAPEAQAGLRRLGDDDALEAAVRARDAIACPLHLAMAGRAGSATRRRVAERIEKFGPVGWASVCHPAAVVSTSAILAPGAFVAAGAIVNPRAQIGRHALVNTGAIVEHDVVVGDGVHLCPGSVTGGGVRIGAWSVIGLGAVIRDHVSIGAGAVVGMGAIVVRTVPDGAWVIGNPARAMQR